MWIGRATNHYTTAWRISCGWRRWLTTDERSRADWSTTQNASRSISNSGFSGVEMSRKRGFQYSKRCTLHHSVFELSSFNYCPRSRNVREQQGETMRPYFTCKSDTKHICYMQLGLLNFFTSLKLRLHYLYCIRYCIQSSRRFADATILIKKSCRSLNISRPKCREGCRLFIL